MRKNNYSSLLLVIFCFGLIIAAAALFLIKGLFADRKCTYIFTCVSVMLVYIAAFLPFITDLISGKTAQLVVSGAVYYKGMSAYAVISAAAVYLAISVIPLKIAIAIQLVALFIFVIYIFMAKITSDKIGSIEDAEIEKKSLISGMRSTAYHLSIMINDHDNSKVKEAINRINDDLRYLSPSSSQEAYELESRMSALIDSMISDPFFRSIGVKSSEMLETKFDDFEFLYKQRKNIY